MPQKNKALCSIAFLIFTSIIQSCSTSKDTITQNQSFKDGDILVSSGSTFAFGFFSPGNSLNRYVGIWFNTVPEQTVVWVANRDNPIQGTNGSLSIEASGNLVLRDLSNNRLVWSTNISGLAADSYFAQLLDSGNLLLLQGLNQSTSRVNLWQSFDFPTNTLLPYMKLGVNRTSGHQWTLTSWKSRDDPGTGDFQDKLELNSSPPQFFLFQNSEKIWRHGPWREHYLSQLPDTSTGYVFSSSYNESDAEVSLLYGLPDPSILSKVTVNESGFLEFATWQDDQRKWLRFGSFPNDICDYYRQCGAFSVCGPYKSGEFECQCLPGYSPKSERDKHSKNATNGCTNKLTGEQFCGNISSVDVEFIKLTSVKLPDTANAIGNRTMGLEECADLCLKNCSCTAYANAYTDNGGSGCITWYGDLMDMRQLSNAGQDVFYIRVSQSELAQYQKNSKRSESKRLIIILVPSVGGILLLIYSTWLVLLKRKDGQSKADDCTDKKALDLPTFKMSSISAATNSFSLTNKIGEGGFGPVYKAELATGQMIAIKRLSTDSMQGLVEFKNEVILISKLQHRNLVRLLGCCIDGQERMLIYEYMPNKSLDNYIYDGETRKGLNWRMRFNIIIGIARGLVYLHRDSRLRIIHRDLKASNILLDKEMNPKISDFGTARAFKEQQLLAKTIRVVGTHGYMAPEYITRGLYSMKSDVFSFGVLILETVSGKRNRDFHPDQDHNLLGHAWNLWNEGSVDRLIDELMEDQFPALEVERCIQVGLLCVQRRPEDRPTMTTVLSMLDSTNSVLPQPNQPAFSNTLICVENSLNKMRRTNGITLTVLEGR
ncbi:OLC1v1021815C3 [Oldenlandia corymbosa var. corymbosa]|uniref:Receptor-like serine/threonine-protein kinase n=1 Tax=Oldenlandia corymbosa var. corymbosa TaxID=529605 RepID=A0AAV1BXU6_OLDCO|nr:OLC1v1021815C3 [Oldenlandia corymbosa var. corymbosa]